MKKIILAASIIGIFGTSFVHSTEAITNPTPKKTICIDAGHQKKQNLQTEPIAPGSKVKKAKVTSGTRGVATKKYEYELNLEVALQLQKALEKKNFHVVMTRTKHDVNLSNIDRATICNNAKSALTIRIHADGSTNKNTQGLSLLYPSGTYTKSINKTSETIAKTLLTETIRITKAKKGYGDGLVPRSDLTGFNWSKTPVVLVEMGFMSNATEDKRLSTKSYQQSIVNGLVNGIVKSVH
ncbi:N-acetylmuramoyl-L-alanine amidase family protein [Gottfriedia luciferensis]|uniref:N-acetylmuramoyl-L-alanine amidase family protein n=1 Tax=Gottfriedia luciferensis TaxID=178774 RepID=UPI000B4549DF|nr:N-acetylmuramoyl-L-alanine amidase [Gottfriedia luciferensis]